MEWSNEQCFQLIDIYARYEVLWNPRDSYYMSKNKKNQAWECVAAELSLDVAAVKQKMLSLLGSFRAQKAKSRKTMASAKGIVEIYTSKWFAFDKMRFLLDKDTEPNITTDTEGDAVEYDDSVIVKNEDISEEESPHLDITQEESDVSNGSLLQLSETPQTSTTKRKQKAQDEPQIEENHKILKKPKKIVTDSKREEMLESYGRYILSKMKNYSVQTQLSVEHEINKILYQADIGYYNNVTDIIPSHT